MKKLALFIVLLSLISAHLSADDKVHWTFRVLQWNYMAYNYTDAVASYVAIREGKAIELNPIGKWYVERLELSIPIVTFANVLSYELSSFLYKHNKPIAYIVMIVFNIVKGYVVYTAIDILNNS